MRFDDLVQASDTVTRNRSRSAKTAVLAALLRQCRPDEVALACAYLTGCLPQGRIGLGPALVDSVVADPAPAATLDLAAIDARLAALASLRGKGVTDRRRQSLGTLLATLTTGEQGFLRRLLLGELRQGALEGLMVDAIAEAFALPIDAVRRAVMFGGDLPAVAAVARRDGSAGLAAFRLALFTPVAPMLAQPVESVDAALATRAALIVEHKLDGARVQVHRDGGDVRIFTRQLHDVTERLPELVAQALALPCRSLVLDGEAMAFDDRGRPLPFQVTMQRFGRRREVEAKRAALPLSARFFDCLHADGEDLTGADTRCRQAALDRLVPGVSVVSRRHVSDAASLAAFLDAALAAGHEGIMAKAPDAPYRAGSRGADWLKLKPVQTLDLVVLAAEWGSGRRQGRLSNLHLGARDPAADGFVMLGKTFKGLTDRLLAWQTEALLARETGRDRNTVYVRPDLVAEIAFNDIQRSPQYPAGLALRFARLRRYREDKTAAEADTIDTVRRLHEARLQ
jgi:DNA ligase-1